MLYWKDCRNSHIHSVLPDTSTIQLFQMPSHSWQAVFMWELFMVYMGFQDHTWDFTDCKKNKSDPKKCLEKAGFACWSIKTVFWRITPTEIGTLIISLILLIVSLRKQLLKELLSSSSPSSLHNLFQHATTPYTKIPSSSNYTNLSSFRCSFMSVAISSKLFYSLMSII